MKSKLLLGLAALCLVHATRAADVLWENPSDTIVPSTANPYAPNIDAVSFLNPQGLTFSITDNTTPYALYHFTDTLNFTNRGYMFGSPGFEFDNETLDGSIQPANWFVNLGGGPNAGIVNVNGASFLSFVLDSNLVYSLPSLPGIVRVHATNIINSGSMELGNSSLLQLAGDNLDLTRGTIILSNSTSFLDTLFGGSFGGALFVPSSGMDGYWAAALQPFGGVPAQDYGGTGFGDFTATNRQFQTTFGFFDTFAAVAYTNQTVPVNSNMLTQIVFITNTNAAFTNLVYFSPADIEVQWQWLGNNYPSTEPVTNSLLLSDNFGEDPRHTLGVQPNGTVFGGRQTYIPVNYNFSFQQVFGGIPASPITNQPISLTDLGLPTANQTNPYTAYQAMFTPGVSLPTDTAGGDVTNIAGRVELIAHKFLNLNNARISSFNYLRIDSQGHYAGNQGAQLLAPNVDLLLTSTNGLLTVSNMVSPLFNYPAGTINLYSCRFTNSTFTPAGSTNIVTNAFHVLIVDSEITPTTTVQVETAKFTADNLVICDALNLTRDLSINAQSLTITTNPDNVFTPVGQLNFLNSHIIWPNAAPGLQYLTNWGRISSSNALFFGGARIQPAIDPTAVNIPYQTFINHGTITDLGTYVWAKYFENDGLISNGSGLFDLEDGFSVRMFNGDLETLYGDVTLTASDLVISNSMINAGGNLTLAVTNYLDDGSYLSNGGNALVGTNFWSAGDGLNLPILPPYASLLNTYISCLAETRNPETILWAGKDLGANVSGFYNNAAVGDLTLSGEDPDSSFVFVPATGGNAIYVKTLDLEGAAATMDTNGVLTGLVIPGNMKVYFGSLTLDGVLDISSSLNTTNNPGLVWVPGILSNTPPANPAPVYPALVLTPPTSFSTSGGGNSGGNSGTSTGPSGPSKLDLPGVTRSGGPAANFIAASYSGLFADTNGIGYSSSGYFTVRTTPQGRFTGKVTWLGVSYSFSGKLANASDVATIPLPQAGLTLSFWLSAGDASQLIGTVSGHGWSADLAAFRQANTKSLPAAATLKGNYTLLIPPADGGPAGTGFGTVKTDSAGNVRWLGTLADGSKVTQGSFFSSGGLWGLYVPLYGGRGAALGWLQLSSGNGTNLSGQCLWVKPAGLGSRYYPGGFTNDVQAVGSSYLRPRSGSVLTLNNGAGTLSFSGGPLSSDVSTTLQLNARSQASSTSSLAPMLSFNPATGLFSGSAFLPGMSGKVPFQGALFQNGNFAAGYFFGTTQSGNVTLTPAP